MDNIPVFKPLIEPEEIAAAQAALERVKQSDKYRARAAQERDLVEQCGRLRALLQRK